MCFCATTGLVYMNCDNYFLGDAMQLNHFLFLKVSSDRTNELLKSSYTYFYAFLALIWTTIFAVKLFFLAFFQRLIERVTKIQKYYWMMIVITLISWIFLVVESFILCPHFGYDSCRILLLLSVFWMCWIGSVKCYDPSRDLLYVSMSGLVIDLDVLTDFFNKSSVRWISIIMLNYYWSCQHFHHHSSKSQNQNTAKVRSWFLSLSLPDHDHNRARTRK